MTLEHSLLMTEHPNWHIRRSRAPDATAILAIRSHPISRRFQPIVPGNLQALERILGIRGSLPLTPRQSSKVQWTVLVDDEPAGWVSLDVTSREHHIGSVGYALAPAYHGRGIASGALRHVVGTAFDPIQLGLERLEAIAAVENIASRRVLEKCDFHFEGIATGLLIIDGERVDHARYELMREGNLSS